MVPAGVVALNIPTTIGTFNGTKAEKRKGAKMISPVSG
jgi:hypothetical protein